MSKYKRFNVGNSGYTYASHVIVDNQYSKLVFASLVGYDFTIKQTIEELNKNNNIYIESHGYYKSGRNKFNFMKHKESNNDFSHIFVTLKDEKVFVDTEKYNLITYLFYKNEEEFNKRLYNKINDYSSIPILEEWIPYIKNKLENDYLLIRRLTNDEDKIKCSYVNLSQPILEEIVSRGLSSKNICIKENAQTSDTMLNKIFGLDDYLNRFGAVLANKIQNSFVPKFVPGEQQLEERVMDFDDYCYYNANIDLFDAQRSIIQANVNNLRKNNVSIVIGEMGSGSLLYV